MQPPTWPSVYPRDPDGELTTIRDIQPSTSPPFTGFLDLRPGKGMEYFTHKLLSAPDETHFRSLAMTRDHEEDIPLAITLIKRVVPPLTLEITPRLFGTSALHFHFHSPVNWFVDSYQRSEVSLREARSSKRTRSLREREIVARLALSTAPPSPRRPSVAHSFHFNSIHSTERVIHKLLAFHIMPANLC